MIDRLIRPAIGKHQVSAVTRQDIAALHRKLAKTPRQAIHVASVLSKFFNWTELRGYRPEGSVNPARVERYKEKSRDRFLSREEYGGLGRVIDGDDINPSVRHALKLLALTGCRLNEVLGLRWSEIDFDTSCIRLGDERSKAGARIVRLNHPAVDILRSIPRIKDNPYVIVGKIAGKHMVNLEKPWMAIRKAAGIEDVTILRHSFASFAAGCGYSELVIGGLLGHSKQGITARYSHLEGDMLARAAEQVGCLISEMMGQ